jgi:hypothetical protein
MSETIAIFLLATDDTATPPVVDASMVVGTRIVSVVDRIVVTVVVDGATTKYEAAEPTATTATTAMIMTACILVIADLLVRCRRIFETLLKSITLLS